MISSECKKSIWCVFSKYTPKKLFQFQNDALKRTSFANSMLGLSLVLFPNTRQYGTVVMNGYKGFKALVHKAEEFPEVGGKGFAIGSGRVVYVGIGAQAIEASEAVEVMPFQRRKCIKYNESIDNIFSTDNGKPVILKAFSHYDQKACYLECKAQYLNESCGCLPYYFPNFDLVWNKSTTCNLTGKMNPMCWDLPQILESHSNILGLQCLAKTSNEYDLNKSNCFCPPDCNSVIYSQEISSEKLYPAYSHTFRQLGSEDNYLGKLLEKMKNEKDPYMQKLLKDEFDDLIDSSSVAHFYFKENGIIKYSQEEVFGMSELFCMLSFNKNIGSRCF